MIPALADLKHFTSESSVIDVELLFSRYTIPFFFTKCLTFERYMPGLSKAKGGSKNTRSYCSSILCSNQLDTSLFMNLALWLAFSLVRRLPIPFKHSTLWSTKHADAAPLLIASRPNTPEPQNKSNTLHSAISISWRIQLNTVSLILLRVGLVELSSGIRTLVRFQTPPVMRVVFLLFTNYHSLHILRYEVGSQNSFHVLLRYRSYTINPIVQII